MMTHNVVVSYRAACKTDPLLIYHMYSATCVSGGICDREWRYKQLLMSPHVTCPAPSLASQWANNDCTVHLNSHVRIRDSEVYSGSCSCLRTKATAFQCHTYFHFLFVALMNSSSPSFWTNR